MECTSTGTEKVPRAAHRSLQYKYPNDQVCLRYFWFHVQFNDSITICGRSVSEFWIALFTSWTYNSKLVHDDLLHKNYISESKKHGIVRKCCGKSD
mmetsp:Transcript_14442/g.62646  ORF Transcript_14442/g.62646 Transcript_14442/m.62646 type:complete len:96 (+) Transcript_14442:1222-1509(+)